MHHTSSVIIPIQIGSLDLSITTPILWSFIAAFLVIALGLWARRRIERVPKRAAQNIFELVIQFIETQIVEPCELDKKRWTATFLVVFLFILFNNLANIIPGAATSSANINMTMTLALFFFITACLMRLRRHGPFGFFKSIIPSGVSGPILIMMVPIELISLLFKPISLAVRLFANMFGGHTLFLTILGFTVMYNNAIVSSFSLLGAIAVALFEIFVCCIQAYIFAFLSAQMLGETQSEH